MYLHIACCVQWRSVQTGYCVTACALKLLVVRKYFIWTLHILQIAHAFFSRQKSKKPTCCFGNCQEVVFSLDALSPLSSLSRFWSQKLFCCHMQLNYNLARKLNCYHSKSEFFHTHFEKAPTWIVFSQTVYRCTNQCPVVEKKDLWLGLEVRKTES